MSKKTDVFVDTSGWACYLSKEEEFHAEVTKFIREIFRKRRQRLITTNYVISELVALLTSRTRLSRDEVIERIDEIKAHSGVEIIHIDPALDDKAWQLLKDRRDKEWSLVDASSMVIMERFSIPQVITTDHHFLQAGFRRVPEPLNRRQ